MKINIALLLLTMGLTATIAFSQDLENNVITWSKQNPIEKLYLHTDREAYYAGQTIWLKGYFMSDYVPSGNSSTVYIELLNDQSAIVLRNVFPVYMGNTIGQMDLPENIPSGVYQLRAYSPLMLNQPGFVFSKLLHIYGNVPKSTKKTTLSKNRLEFFSEGGNFITNELNIVAFKATDKDGMPLDVTGEVRNEKHELLTSFKSLHDGMGTFAIIPLPEGSYYATINGSPEKYPLPQQTTNGIVFSVKNSSKGKVFKIVQGGNDPTFRPAYMIGQMENEILFKQPFSGNKKEINGLMPTQDVFSGILQLTVFNKDGMPLAERLTFIDNKEYILPAELKLDTLDTGKRKRNHFSLILNDSIQGNFSAAITDADYENGGNRPSNIYSWMLLNSHIKGYVHNPAYYFSSDADSVKNELDLVMMTNGWTRFKWTDAKENKLPQPKYKDPGYINLNSTVFIEGRKKVLPNTDIIMMISPQDTVNSKRGMTRFLSTDSLGQLQMEPTIFFDKMKILFSDVRGKKSKYISVKLHNDSLRRSYPVQWTPTPYTDSSASNLQEKMTTAFNEYIIAEGKTLETVTVRATQKSELQKLDEEYASGLFAGGINSRTLDLRNETYSGDIFQYLQGRIPGLVVSGGPGDYTLNYRGGGFQGGNVSLFLDEVPSDVQMIESIPVSQIALVKLLPNSVATMGGGTAIAIYMKKGAELNASIESPTDIIDYNGYTIIKEFYNPDYDLHPNNEKVDNRLTLSWNPNIYVADVNPHIPIIFYNNDHTKRYKLVVEGVTHNGRMLMIEKIIDTNNN